MTKGDSGMLILASGEGPTDIGKAYGNYDVYAPGYWEPGPMAYFISSIVDTIWNFDPLDASTMWFIPEVSLNAIAKNMKPLSLARNREFTKSARALLASARKLAQERDCKVLPILFRDTDGSCSQRTRNQARWQEKHDSIAYCMDRTSNIMHVCPMLPNPKSEAWLLCALQNNYRSCADLESLSGNDKSPNNVKSMLEDCLSKPVTRSYLVELIESCIIKPDLIDMPSFNSWKNDLCQMSQGHNDLSEEAKRYFQNIENNVRVQRIL